MRRLLVCASLLLVAASTGCRSKEVARVHLRAPGTAETKWRVAAAKPYDVWHELQGKWRGRDEGPHGGYRVELLRNGKRVSIQDCQIASGALSVCAFESDNFGTHDANCEKSTSCAISPPSPGMYTLRATLRFDKPGEVIDARDFSLVVRE